MIKYVGFIKEYNNIDEAHSIKEIKNNEIFNDSELIQNIISYLDKGKVVLAWMHYITDIETNQPLVPDCYYTDGVWVWPEYFKYYLKKYVNYPINKEFIDFLNKNNFKIKTKINLSDLEDIVTKKVGCVS